MPIANAVVPLALTRTRRAFVHATAITLYCASAFAACSDPTDPESLKAISELTGPAATVSVGQGFSTKTIIAIKRTSAFDGVVQLAAEGLPPGMLVSFAPASLSSTATLSEMTINALSTIAPGAHTFTVRASGEGVASKTVTVSVMVTVPAITVAASSTTANVPQGSTHVIPITITREGGFTGIVGLSLLGLPTGVTASFAPPAIQSDATASTLTLSAPLTAQLGARTLTLRASAQGLADKTIPIALTVAPATTPAVLVSASPPFLQVDGGSFIETMVTLQRFAGFDGAVHVAVEGLPANLTATVVPVAAGSNTTTLRINAGPGEPGGNYALSLRATGTGIQQASTGLTVQTRPMPQFGLVFSDPTAPPLERFRISQPVTVNRGATATLPTLEIFRVTQYNLPVSLSVTGVPQGVTINLPTTIPSSTTTQTFVITINVGPDVAPGVYTLTVLGQTSTPMTREVTIVLTVN